MCYMYYHGEGSKESEANKVPNYCLTKLAVKPVKPPVKSRVFSVITTYESPALPLSYAAKSNDFNRLHHYLYILKLFPRN
jgi:hypothetical protein